MEISMKKQLKILIVEDDPNICELIKLYTEKQGYLVITASNGEEGLERYFDENPDLVILDIMLPKMNGWEICQEIRRDQMTPIIMLTAKGESYDKIKGLDLGADDYVVKPFDPNELMARVKAVLRRTSQIQENIELPNLVIDIKQYKVYIESIELVMPPKELELLYFLALNANQVFTRQQLLDRLWGYDYDGDPRTIDVHIKRIREKIGEQINEWSLKTIRGVGYKFEVIR